MVVTDLPTTLATGVMQDRIGRPSRCTVQAPQRADETGVRFVPIADIIPHHHSGRRMPVLASKLGR
jgi:hypothetical protein